MSESLSNINLLVFTGPMYAGKTSKLMEYYNKSMKKHKLVIKFANDNRYTNKNELCTHDKKKLDANSIYNINQINILLENNYYENNILYDEIYIDEAQLYDGNIYKWYMNIFDNYLFNNVKNIYLSCLDYDAEKLIFDKNLDKLIHTKNNVYILNLFSRCYLCNKKARFTKKINKNINYSKLTTEFNPSNKNILIGDTEIYQPSCLKHFYI